jgi:Tfp pilus assembly pilus retraction ATPase PilT
VCRPAFRVNGEIIIADEDALSEADVTGHGRRHLLNEQQKKKFEQEWELCIFSCYTAWRAVCARRSTGATGIPR